MTTFKDTKDTNTTNTNIGEKFQQETKYDPDKPMGYALDWSRRPKSYKNHESPLAYIPLSKPDMKSKANLWKLLQHRRSRREYNTKRDLKENLLSALLWATQGCNCEIWRISFQNSTLLLEGSIPVETYFIFKGG